MTWFDVLLAGGVIDAQGNVLTDFHVSINEIDQDGCSVVDITNGVIRLKSYLLGTEASYPVDKITRVTFLWGVDKEKLYNNSTRLGL